MHYVTTVSNPSNHLNSFIFALLIPDFGGRMTKRIFLWHLYLHHVIVPKIIIIIVINMKHFINPFRAFFLKSLCNIIHSS